MKYIFRIIIAGMLLIPMGCRKFLDEKSRQSLAVPVTLKDFQALLDYHFAMNQSDPGAAEVSADDYYLSVANYNSLQESFRRMYTWEPDRIFEPEFNDWSRTFQPVYRSNLVLQNIAKVNRTPANEFQWNDVKGQAHFYRAKCFLQAALIWTMPYDKDDAAGLPGLPLRLTDDFNKPSVRSTNEQTWQQILADAKQAANLLPVHVQHCIRPSKAAALALVARTYLAMRQYDSCFKYADASLQLNNTLLDYNLLNPSLALPFQSFPDNSNPEILHLSYMPNPAPVNRSKALMDSFLCASYTANDLRKTIFLKNNNNGTFSFKGTYHTSGLFSGMAVDEVYLMKAECNARNGNTTAALNDLNTLLSKRWKSGTFIPFTAATPQQALDLILMERRKELLMRGLRFMDIKRQNKEGANILLTRKLDNTLFTLPPGDLRYALSIPEDVIEISGMQQNPR